VHEAGGGEECLALFDRIRPGLIMLDMRMAPMDGRETLARLRALPGGREVRVVSFSASAFNFSRADALALGCDDFVAKPFREAELLDVIGRLLDLRWIVSDLTAQAAARAGDRFEPEQARMLLEPARLGDAASLREALRRVGIERPELSALVAEFDALAARFQMQEIRNRLERMIAHER